MKTKVKIKDVCFVVYSLPSYITKTTKISERENVVFQILPKDLINELKATCSEFEYHAEKILKPAIRGKLYFIKYPLKKWKQKFDELVSEYNEKLKEFAERTYRRIDELKKGVAEFCKKYGLDRELSESILTKDYLYARFRIKIQLLPMKLGESLNLPILSQDEVKAIENDVKAMVERAYRETLNREVGRFFKALGHQIKRLQSGKMIPAHSIEKMRSMYDEVASALNVLEYEKYTPAFDIMGKLIFELSQRQKEHETVKGNRRAVKAIAFKTLEVMKPIANNAKPIIEDFKEIVIEGIEAKPVKTAKDHELKELIEGIVL